MRRSLARLLIQECCLSSRLFASSSSSLASGSMAATAAPTAALLLRPASRTAATLTTMAAARPPRQAPATPPRRAHSKARPIGLLSSRTQHRGAASSPARLQEEEEGAGAGGPTPASTTAAAQGPSTFRRPPRSSATRTTPTASRASKRMPDLSPSFVKPPAMPRAVWEILDTLQAAGHPTFLVGGAVRDTLLGGRPKDFDILTTAPPSVLTRLFARARVVGARYPITHILAGAGVHEVSTLLPAEGAGVEGQGGGGGAAVPAAASLPPALALNARATRRRAAVATLNSGAWPADPASREAALTSALIASAASRDFTVNALFLDARTGRLHDPTGRGVADLASRTLTCVSPDPAASFREDPARMLRAIRLSSRAGLKLSPPDVAALRACAGLVGSLPSGRLAQELSALVAHGSAARAVALAREWGMLAHLLPAHAALLDRECGPVGVGAPAEPAELEGEEGEAAAAAATPPRALTRVEGMAALVALDACTLPHRPASAGLVAAALAMPLLADAVRRWRPKPQQQQVRDGAAEEEAEEEPPSPRQPPEAVVDAVFTGLVGGAMDALGTPVPCGDGAGSMVSKAAMTAGARMIRKAALHPGPVPALAGRAGSKDNVFLIGRRLVGRVREALEKKEKVCAGGGLRERR